jgi:hypothetical protein
MSTPADILAKQAEYASRPFACSVETSHFSGVFRFHTEGEAFDYLFQSFERVRKVIETRAYGNAWVGFDCRRSYVEGPQGRTPARFVLLVDELRSH